MKFAVLISARSTSSRLPGKHLLDLGSYYPLQVLTERLKNILGEKIQICVATTTNKEDEIFEQKSIPGILVFRGSVDNIPYRQLQAAKALCADWIISVDGDDVLTSPEAIQELISVCSKMSVEDEKTFYTSGLPLGMNVSCYSTCLLQKKLMGKETHKLETGWGRIFTGVTPIELKQTIESYPEKILRFTLDYPEDFRFFNAIVDHFKDRIYTASTTDIISFVVNDEIYKLNESVVQKYWDNFYKEKEKEENANK